MADTRIKDLIQQAIAAGDFVAVDPAGAGDTYKVPAGQADGIAMLDSAGKLASEQHPVAGPNIADQWITQLGTYSFRLGIQNKLADGNGTLNGKGWTTYGSASAVGEDIKESGAALVISGDATSAEAGAYADVGIYWATGYRWYVLYEPDINGGNRPYLKIEFLDNSKNVIATVYDQQTAAGTPVVVKIDPTALEPGGSAGVRYLRIRIYWPTGTAASWVRQRIAVTWRYPDVTALRDTSGSLLELAKNGTGVIEYGSNANGKYVRFADGTQICWANLTSAINTATENTATTGNQGLTVYIRSALWTYPAAFIATPVVFASAEMAGDHLEGASPYSIGAASTNVAANSLTSGTYNYVVVAAIGRWK